MDIIIDADLCIKLGGSSKYRFLYDILPLAGERIYMHTHAYHEVMAPMSAVNQLRDLIAEGKITLVNEKELRRRDRAVYDAAYKKLSSVMIDAGNPDKNKGEVCSLAYAKTAGIAVFATDEKDLQPMIDMQLNTGMDDIYCLRIADMIQMAKHGEIPVSRKTAKALWIISGKSRHIFDIEIWPAQK